MSESLSRFNEWIDENFPQKDYASAEDRIDALEKRIIADGNVLHKNVRDMLLSEWMEYYTPEYREAKRRYEEQLEIARFLGNGEIPKSFSEEVIESLQRPEIMDIDFSTLPTRYEEVQPPEIKRFTRWDYIKGNITSSVKGFFRRLFGME